MGQPQARSVLSLARIEGRRLVTHPAFLLFTTLTVVWFVSLPFGAGPAEAAVDDFQRYSFVVGAGLVPVAGGAGLAANLAATRARRSRAEELYASVPASAPARTAAHLLSVGYALVASIVVVATVATLLGAWNGLATPRVPGAVGRPRSLTPSLAELAQGPAFVSLVGVVGVALAAWVRSAVAASLAILVGLYLQVPAVLWWSWDWQRWLLPLASGLRTNGSVEVSSGHFVLDVLGVDRAGMLWHLLYLLGLTTLVGVVALARSRGFRRLRGAAAGGLVAASVGGVLQVASSA